MEKSFHGVGDRFRGLRGARAADAIKIRSAPNATTSALSTATGAIAVQETAGLRLLYRA